MSKSRKMKSAYNTLPPRGPNGEKLCRWCKVQVKPPKQTFCGDPKCLHEWQIRTNPSYLRDCVKKRDKQICSKCNLDCKVFQRKLQELWRTDKAEYEKATKGLKVSKTRLFGSIWDADHIVPVCEGGGECGLENIRTLCLWCHREETNTLLAKRAVERNQKPPSDDSSQ